MCLDSTLSGVMLISILFSSLSNENMNFLRLNKYLDGCIAFEDFSH